MMMITLLLRISVEAQNCGGSVDFDTNDYVTSPGWPEQYDDSQECDWTVDVPVDVEVIVEFDPTDPFEVEAAASGAQCYDLVSVRIIESDETSLFCGNSFDHAFVEENNIHAESQLQFFGSFSIKFKSDGSTTGIGFKVRFRRVIPLTTTSTTATSITTTASIADISTSTTVLGCRLRDKRFDFGSMVEPVCPVGSVYAGPPLHCTSNGTWNQSEAQCRWHHEHKAARQQLQQRLLMGGAVLGFLSGTLAVILVGIMFHFSTSRMTKMQIMLEDIARIERELQIRFT